MLGGTGNDTYYVDNAGDIAKELRKQGTDTVVSQTANVTLSANVENLIFEDLVAGATGIGNKLNNKMTAGNSGADLSGLGGNDTLVGNASAFSMLRAELATIPTWSTTPAIRRSRSPARVPTAPF